MAEEQKRDYRAEVTADIVRMLEEGTAPWQKPWKDGAGGRMPFNPTTGKPYRGGNVLALSFSAMRKGYSDNRWMTYRQAAEKGWQVRKGEKATAIEFWEVKPGKSKDENAEEKDGVRLVHKTYAVFNADQIDGIPPVKIEARKEWQICDAGEKIMKDSGADIRYGGDRAFYRRDTDHIQLPNREMFPDAPAFYGTAAHELMHWTGAEKRLNRETLVKSKGFNAADDNYARDEMVSEIGAWMIALEKGIPYDASQHAAYVSSWIKALKNDKNEIFRAASAASKAVDYLLKREQEIAPAEQASHAERITASRGGAAHTR